MPEYMKWADVPTEERKFYKKTTFTAASCGCQLVFMWDDRTSEEDRLHLPFDTLHACDRHKHLRHADNHEELHEAVYGENVYFTTAMLAVLQSLPVEQKRVIKDDEGNEFYEFKRPPAFEFNDKGELTVYLSGGTDDEKKACQVAAIAAMKAEEYADPDYHPNCPKLKPFRNRKVFVK